MERTEIRRYARQIILPEIGLEGQEKLSNSSILIVGLGGLGSPIAQYLVGAGVGRIGLCEYDQLEIHNLQRQTLYTTPNVGRSKLEVAIEHLALVNPSIKLEAHTKLEAANARETMADYDLIVDGTDNIKARYLISDTSVTLQKTCVWGGAVRWEGMASVFDHNLSLRDAFPEPPDQPDDCDTLGVHGPLLGMVGSIMASQALKHLVGLETLYGKLWFFDALETKARIIKLKIPEAPSE
jgi:molybdopterin/thiamine biosynthesis adenylyltransferase